jgi:zinc-binding alcohol dehydrogenase/oxidoreductase
LKAFIHEGKKGIEGTIVRDFTEPSTPKGHVKVQLKCAGLNHRDLFVIERRRGDEPAVILGSDGAGIITEIGVGAKGFSVGDEVVINPSLDWMVKTPAPPAEFRILGFPDHGTLAERIVLPIENIEPKPGYLSWEEAGVLPLAALTAYRALFTRARATKNDTIFIPGIGSGVALFLLKFAKAIGARVIVSSRSEEKREQARKLGADKAIDTAKEWCEELSNEKADIVFESIGTATFNRSMDMLKPGGTMVTFGATTGDDIRINLRQFFYGQFNLLGTTMGSREEFKEMLSFISEHEIKPVVDCVYPLVKTNRALERLEGGRQFGKIAVKVSD